MSMFELPYGHPVESRPAGPITCSACGCRLAPAAGLEGTAWRHFQIKPGQDARGDRPVCLDELHRADGTVFRPIEDLMEAPALS